MADGRDTRSLPAADRGVVVKDLRCDYAVNPLGIDTPEPRLSWRLGVGGQGSASFAKATAARGVRGLRQTAYRVLVSGSPEKLSQDIGDLWDSGKVESDQSVYVAYAGKPLVSKTACHWKVRVWLALSGAEGDKDNKPGAWSETAKWTMGLLEPGDWQAQWIGAPAGLPAPFAPPANDTLTVTKATYRTLDGSVAVDVTEIVKKELAKKKPFTVDFRLLGGDPAPNIVKELVVEFVHNGKPGVAHARDFHALTLPGRSSGAPGKPAPLFRREFDLAAAPESAYVTVHSLNYFEVYINGSKAGKDVLTPAVSNPDHQSFTVTCDVGRHLRPGRNCIGLWLGEGWADGIAVRAQLDAVVDGKPVTIGTDTSWQARRSGWYRIGGRKWNDYGGERVDAREILPDWSRPGLDTASWTPAVAATPPRGPARTQPCPLNRIGREIPAAAVTAVDGGRYEIDFGTALTGWLRLKMPALLPGATVRMTFADVRRGNKYQHFNQVSEFVSSGKAGEMFENKFNYAGFRYVVVDGLRSAPAKEDATALLIESDLEEAGAFECSNELLNRIHRVNQWTQRCLNLGGYYVDCPHRERWGYGDGQVAAEGFMTSFRADGYYRKWLRDWRLRQRPDGNLPHVAPLGKGGGGPGWGGLLSAITWRHYLYYGDRRVLEENYDAVRRYVDYLESICKDGVMRKFGGMWDFIGDWVPPRRGMDGNAPSGRAAELFNNCYRINQMKLLTQMAAVLGKSDDAARYGRRLAEIRPVVHAAFHDADKQEYVIDEQAYYVMPLMTGVTPESLRPVMLKKLERNILEKRQGHLDTGMLGTYFMMEYLRETGRNDLVFTMFNQTTYPGWGHMLAEGATTFWEQWNGHWSHIHSCFTSPDNWLYQGLAGIKADPAAPGFRNVIIKPAMPALSGVEGVGDVTWVKAHHDGPYGRIVSNWTREDGKVTLHVEVPPNSTATVHVPGRDPARVTEGGKPPGQAEGVRFIRRDGGRLLFGVQSGSYDFVSAM